MADPTLPLPLEVPWTLASTTQPLVAGDPDQTSISLFFFEPNDANLTSDFPDQRLIFLKFTVSVSPATIPGLPPVTALGEGVPCLHLLLDLRIRKKSGELGTIRPYFHAAAPMHRSIVQTGVVGVDTFEGESDEQSIGRSGSQMRESSSTHARTTSASLNAGIGIGPLSIGGSASTTSTDVSGQRAVSQQIDTTQRDASQERRELISHMSKVENVLTLLNAKYVGTPFLSFSLSPPPLQLLSVDPGNPNLWFSQLLSRRSSGIEGVQEYTAIVLVPKGEDFCVNARLRRVCVLDVPPGPLVFEPFNFNRHLGPVLVYLDRVYPVGTPLEELDVDLTGSLPNPQSFPRPIVDVWVVSGAGYMIADIASPPPGPNPGNVSRTNLAYKHLFEIWLEVQRDDYERAVARSPIERGLLLGETRTLDTCFAFLENALTVSGSTTSVSPLTRFIVDPPLVDLGGVSSDASAITGSVKDRAYEAFTRWNLLDGRLSTLLSNRRTFPQRKLSFGDAALVDLTFERWARMLTADPQNLPIDDAAKALGLSDAQRKLLKAAGATDLRTLGQMVRATPEIERYNERLAELRPLYKAEKVKAALPDAVTVRLSTRDVDSLRKTIATTFAKADASGGA
jgi:hypothetical protein